MYRKYESNKTKQHLKYLVVLIPIVQVCSLLFFSLVGKYEKIDTDLILQSSRGIVTLSSTVTLSIITIYVVYVLNKSIVLRYIGNFRERTYIYPNGRNKMFTSKLNSAICTYSMLYIFALSITSTIYIFFDGNVLRHTNLIFYFVDVLGIFTIVIMSLMISLTVILFSLIFGIKFQSTNVSLITAIISIVIIGNVVANSYILSNRIMLLISICVYLIIYSEIKYLSSKVKNDDVMG